MTQNNKECIEQPFQNHCKTFLIEDLIRIYTSIDPNPRLYQEPRGIKSLELQTFLSVILENLRRGLHLGRFDVLET